MASLNPLTGVLGHRLAAHLLRRTTFAPSRQNIDNYATKTVDEAIEELVVISPPFLAEPIDYETGTPWINSGGPPISQDFNLKNFVRAWWLDEARRDNSIGHKMMFFLHTNFTTSGIQLYSEHNFDHLQLLRHYALGNFKTLALKVTKDNLMLSYLNNNSNNKWNPNENYAREFLELFTIGKGEQIGPGDYTNYTEADVAEAARLLTGFRTQLDRSLSIDPDTGIPTGRVQLNWHDTGDKTFSSAFQNTTITGATTEDGMHTELESFVDMIFAQDETARFICRKIYRYFVSKNITDEIEQDIIEPLATTFRTNDYNLEIVLKQLLKSQHYYDRDDSNSSDEIIGGMVKSPLDLVLGSLNYFRMSVPDPITDSLNHYNNFYRRGVMDIMFYRAGFDVFRPDLVVSYPAYSQEPEYSRTWFSSNTIIARYKLPQMLLEGKRVLAWGDLGGVQLDIVAFVENFENITDAFDPAILVSELLDYMLSEFPDNDRYQYYLNDIFLDGLFIQDWYYEWQNYLDSGDDSEVRIPLENLVKAIMYSPEYHPF